MTHMDETSLFSFSIIRSHLVCTHSYIVQSLFRVATSGSKWSARVRAIACQLLLGQSSPEHAYNERPGRSVVAAAPKRPRKTCIYVLQLKKKWASFTTNSFSSDSSGVPKGEWSHLVKPVSVIDKLRLL